MVGGVKIEDIVGGGALLRGDHRVVTWQEAISVMLKYSLRDSGDRNSPGRALLMNPNWYPNRD
jgi:hypothetical protein